MLHLLYYITVTVLSDKLTCGKINCSYGVYFNYTPT